MSKIDTTAMLIHILASVLSKTWRYHAINMRDTTVQEGAKGVIFCTWHETILALSRYVNRLDQFSLLVSGSKDGQRLSAIFKRWKASIVTGSSSRGGMSAVRNAVRALTTGQNLVITPDGPRGPRREIKEGVALIAKLSGALVVPLYVQPNSYWRLTSWDRFMIPWPFTKITVQFGEALTVGKNDTIDSVQSSFFSTMEQCMNGPQQKVNL